MKRTTKIGGLTGDRLIAFACLGSTCPTTCCGPFHGTRALRAVLTPEDLGHPLDEPAATETEVSIFAQIRLTPEDVARLQQAGLDRMMVYRGDAREPAHYLRLRNDGSCSALTSTNTCGIHQHRPTICRAFPFYLDLFAGLSMVESCPGVGSGEQPLSALAEEIRSAVAMYRFWLEILRATGDE